MATSELDILIKIRSELSQLKTAQTELGKTAAKATGLGQALKSGIGFEIASKAVNMFSAAITTAVGNAFRMSDEIRNASSNLQIGAEAYQVLAGAVRDAGGDSGTLNSTLVQLRKSVQDAAEGAGGAAAEFGKLGIKADDLVGLPLERQFESVAKAVAGAKDKSSAFGSAMQILGARNAPQLMSALQRLGADGFGKLRAEVKATWGLFSDDELERLATAKSKLDQFANRATIAVGNVVGDTLEQDPEVLDDIINGAAAAANAVRGMMRSVGATAGGLFTGDLETAIATMREYNGERPVAKKPVVRDEAAIAAAAEKRRQAEEQISLLRTQYALEEAQFELEEKSVALSEKKGKSGEADAAAEYNKALSERNGLLSAYLQLLLETAAKEPSMSDSADAWKKFLDQQKLIKDAKEAKKKADDTPVALKSYTIDGSESVFTSEMRRFGESEKQATDSGIIAANSLAMAYDGVAASIADSIVYAEDFGDAMRNVSRRILAYIVEMIIKQTILNAVMGAIGGGGGGASAGASSAGSIKAAGGGTFVTSGPTHLTVGDNPGGRELVQVTPLSGVGRTIVRGNVARFAGGGTLLTQPSSSGGGTVINVYQTINVSTGVVATVRAEVAQMLPQLKSASVDAVREAQMRGSLKT